MAENFQVILKYLSSWVSISRLVHWLMTVINFICQWLEKVKARLIVHDACEKIIGRTFTRRFFPIRSL